MSKLYIEKYIDGKSNTNKKQGHREAGTQIHYNHSRGIKPEGSIETYVWTKDDGTFIIEVAVNRKVVYEGSV